MSLSYPNVAHFEAGYTIPAGRGPDRNVLSRALPKDSTEIFLLAEVTVRADRLTVTCRACGRNGVLQTSRLIAQQGPATPMTLRRLLAGDCPRLQAARTNEPSDCHFPDLSRLFPPG